MWEQRRRMALKLLMYVLLTFFVFAAQCALPAAGAWRVRPQLLIPLTALIAFREGPRIGGGFGFFCGMLCDWLSVRTVSYYAVALMLAGAALGLLIDYSMRRNILSAVFVSLISLVLVQAVFFCLFIWLSGLASPYALVTVTTPEILYSLVFVPPLYLLTGWVNKRTAPKGRKQYGGFYRKG